MLTSISAEYTLQKPRNYDQRKFSKIFSLYYHIYQTLYNSVTIVFLVNNRTVPKDQIKTLISQTELTRKCHNNGLHYFLQSFTVAHSAIPGQRSCTLWLTANSYSISWLGPKAPPHPLIQASYISLQ